MPTHALRQSDKSRATAAQRGSGRPSHSVLRLQATAGNSAVCRMLSGRAVQRMKIGGYEYTRGSTVRFATDYLAAKKRKLDPAEIQRVFGTDKDGFNVLFNVLATGTAEFADLDEFIREVNIMRRDWGAQKLFYDKPGSLTENPSDVQGQEAGRTITLYSARGVEKVQRILWWAVQNNIPIEGFEGHKRFRLLKPGDATIDAPFKGHFGDRSHTVKHLRQKQDSFLMSIVLNASGSRAVTDLKKNFANMPTSAEGYRRGAFGLKSEADFVSVAIGASSDTWDYLKDKIQLIRLHPAEKGKGPSDFSAAEQKRRSHAPARIPGVGRIVDVPGTGMNCLIRAIYRALNMHIDDAQFTIIRSHLESQRVAREGKPLDLVGAAGAVLVSFLVQQGVIAAARGLEVYTPDQQNPPHVVVAGAQPIRLWLSGEHFQAIVPV